MERLTYKLDEPVSNKYLHYEYMKIAVYDINKGNCGRITNDKIYNKLGQLEDLEEELGIDIITLFKALKQDYIYFKEFYRWDNKFKINKEYISGLKCIDDNTIALFTNNYYGKEHIVYLKDYGTKWALRKEDLQDEKGGEKDGRKRVQI